MKASRLLCVGRGRGAMLPMTELGPILLSPAAFFVLRSYCGCGRDVLVYVMGVQPRAVPAVVRRL
jgi:hypothetical protein